MIDRIKIRKIDASQGVKTSMVTAQKCPVCNGFGTLKFGSLICHGCKGRGYIFIPIEQEYDK